jgi:hypothetical protein
MPKLRQPWIRDSLRAIGTIASLALVGSVVAAAQVQRMPAELLGEWCVVATDPLQSTQNLPAMYRPGSCRDTDGWMTVTLDGYRAHEMGCKLLNSALDEATRIYRMQYSCDGEGERWIEEASMQRTMGVLLMSTRQMPSR